MVSNIQCMFSFYHNKISFAALSEDSDSGEIDPIIQSKLDFTGEEHLPNLALVKSFLEVTSDSHKNYPMLFPPHEDDRLFANDKMRDAFAFVSCGSVLAKRRIVAGERFVQVGLLLKGTNFDYNSFDHFMECSKDVFLIPSCYTQSLDADPILIDNFNCSDFEDTTIPDNLLFYACSSSPANMVLHDDFVAVSTRAISQGEKISLRFALKQQTCQEVSLQYHKSLSLLRFVYDCEIRIQRDQVNDGAEVIRLQEQRTTVLGTFESNRKFAVKDWRAELSKRKKNRRFSIDDNVIKLIVLNAIDVVMGKFLSSMIVDTIEDLRPFPERYFCFDYVKKVFKYSNDPIVHGRRPRLESEFLQRMTLFIMNGKSLVHSYGHCIAIEGQYFDLGVVQILAAIDIITSSPVGTLVPSIDGVTSLETRNQNRQKRVKDLRYICCRK